MKRDQICTKNKKALLTVTMAVLFFSSSTWADLGDTLVLCKNNKTVRTLRVEVGEDKVCKAIYTKQGVDETIGSGLNHQSCIDFITGVRKKLESASWSCREVKEARTSSVTPVSE